MVFFKAFKKTLVSPSCFIKVVNFFLTIKIKFTVFRLTTLNGLFESILGNLTMSTMD